MAHEGPGRRRRRRRAPGRPTAADAPQRGGAQRQGWRATVDSFGGFLTIGSIAGAIIIVLALVVLSQRGGGAGVSGAPYEPLERGAVSGRVEGDPGAPVRIYEFSDFQCPFCRNFHEQVAPLLRAEFIETGEAVIEYVPVMVLGPDSQRANEAALCAEDQGRFWEMHDVLFLRQSPTHTPGAFSRDRLKEYAREVEAAVGGLDLARFDACLDSGEKSGDVAAIDRQARAAGISSTPSVVIGSQLIPGLHPIERYREAVSEALAQR